MTRNFWLGLVASVVVLAAAVGIAFALDRRGSDVELPDTLDGMHAFDSDAGQRELGADDDKVIAESIRKTRSAQGYAEDQVSDAYDGADADIRQYTRLTDDGSNRIYQVTAVAAESGPLLPEGGFPDPERLGVAFPTVDRTVDGEVACLARYNPVPDGGDDVSPDDHIQSVVCQRTSGSLTVRVQTGVAPVDSVVDVTNAAWDDLD